MACAVCFQFVFEPLLILRLQIQHAFSLSHLHCEAVISGTKPPKLNFDRANTLSMYDTFLEDFTVMGGSDAEGGNRSLLFEINRKAGQSV
ncbi:hypothetical protein BT69DRAFT_765677 [Atractiella rhizophila]|nr:hypothetical protein BT69DRAFT_765677 [Atractiella rhizophila]